MRRFVSFFLFFILLTTTLVSQAKNLADVEKAQYFKPGPSPMDKKSENIVLKEGDSVSRVNAKTISLDGEWLITDKGMNDFKNAYKISVPSSIAYALHKAGVIEDPYIGLNDFDAKKLGEKTWYLKKTFTYTGSKKMLY